jgi:ABC-type transporter Mla maintaining outer membrane lipid asymmetry ATPase subunit MlaF
LAIKEKAMSVNSNIPEIEVKNLTVGYGSRIILKDLNFSVKQGEIMVIMGGSGCGKRTLLKHIIGLYQPLTGDILIRGQSIVNCSSSEKRKIMSSFGVTYQGGALFGSMTVGENVALPLQEYTDYSSTEIEKIVNEFNYNFVDVFDEFVDANNYLIKELSPDGIHLNSDGYVKLSNFIKPYLN